VLAEVDDLDTTKNRSSLFWAILGALTPILWASSAVAQSQSTVPDVGRTNPAAWRPSFNPVDEGARAETEFLQNSANSQQQNPANPFSRDSSGSNSSGSNNGGSDSDRSASGSGSNGANGSDNRSDSSQRDSSRADQADPSKTGDRFNTNPNNRPGVTRVSRTFERLPNSAGQVWREYDITPYTSQLGDAERPQQAVMDWILKETGTRLWFHEPLGILSSDSKKVMVYHTPEIQREVRDIIDRFNRTRAQVQLFDVNLCTVQKPNWRSLAYPVLQPIEVSSPGIEAWVISKENAAVLQGQLARRGDFKMHTGGRAASPDGQTIELQKATPVSFVQSIEWTPNQFPNYRPKTKSINEGYRLAISCLTTLDNRSIEAIIDCDVDQVEKLNPVKVDLPGPNGRLNQLELKVPQLVSWRINERIRWPSDEVLLISCGIVASPESKGESPGGGAGILSRFSTSKRSDALLFVEYRGPQSGATVPRSASSSNELVPIRGRER